MSASRPVALLLAIATLSAAGCGGAPGEASDDPQGSNGDTELASSDTAEVLQAQRTIDAACGSDGSGTPDRSAAAIGDAVSTIARLTEQYPGSVYETGNVDRAETLRTVSRKVSEQLRRCGITAQAERLAQAAGGA